MTDTLTLDAIYTPSEDVVARVIEGELIIIPLLAGIGDLDDEIFTMNETGKAIWQKLDGKASLGGVAAALAKEYDAPAGQIEQDVLGMVEELARRRMLIEVSQPA